MRSRGESNNPVTIADTIREVAARLKVVGIATSRLDAGLLLRHVLGIDRTQLLIRLREPLGHRERDKLNELVERRLAGQPVAYLTGNREFYGLPFAVGPGVLVPRPETELLVEWSLTWLGNRQSAAIVDVGTGSGAIALSVAANRAAAPDVIAASDLSPDALRYTAANRRRLGLERNVHLVRGDLLTWHRGPVDLILANLPYLRPDQMANNDDLWAEPRLALVSGADGLTAIARLLEDAPRVLSPAGAIGLEIDPAQSDAVRTLAQSSLPDARVCVLRDLAGLDRFVVADRSSHPR